MTAPEPTRPADEHTDAVARVLYLALPDPDVHRWDHLDTLTRAHYRTLAAALLTTPAVHAAMLDALVRAGVLTPEDAPIYRGAEHHHWQQRWDGEHTHEGGRYVTPWEVAP